MKFVTLAKEFTVNHPKFNRPTVIKKGSRFGIRKGNMFEGGDHGYKGCFIRVHYFDVYVNLEIPYEYLTNNSVKTLKEISTNP
jgi:hypothetical protein